MHHHRFQFSIRWILVATAIVAVGAWLWVTEPSWWPGLVGMLLTVYFAATCGIIFCQARGYAKAFWLGVFFGMGWVAAGYLQILIFASQPTQIIPPALIQWRNVESGLEQISCQLRMMVSLWAFAAVVGLLCMGSHWVLTRSNDRE